MYRLIKIMDEKTLDGSIMDEIAKVRKFIMQISLGDVIQI